MRNVYHVRRPKGRPMFSLSVGIISLLLTFKLLLKPTEPSIEQQVPIEVLSKVDLTQNPNDSILLPENLHGQTTDFWSNNQEYLQKYYNRRFLDVDGGTEPMLTTRSSCSDLHPPSEPSCDGEELIWNNPVTVNECNVSVGVRFIGGGKISLSLPSAFSNPVRITIDEAISWDGYQNRVNVTQNDEKWRVVFKSNGVYTTSSYTKDVHDQVMSSQKISSLGTFEFPNGVDEIWLAHAGESAPFGDNISGPNSVVPVSVCLSYEPLCVNPDFEIECEANINGAGWHVLNNCSVSACAGSDVKLSVNPNVSSVTWTGPNGFNATGNDISIHDVNTNDSGSYKATVTYEGCTSTETINLSVEPEVVANVSPDVEICKGSSTTLTASGGGTYKWNTGATTASITVSPESTTTYGVTVTDGDCNDSDEVTVTVLPNISNGGTIGQAQQSNCGPFNPPAFTNVSSPSGDANGRAIEYLWLVSTTSCSVPTSLNDPNWTVVSNTGPTYDPGMISETTCFLRCSRYEGCDEYIGESNIIQIVINDSPTAGLTKNMDWNCYNQDEATILTATPASGVSYQWSAGANPVNGTNTAKVTEAGTYYVTVTDENGCKDVASVTVIEDKTAPSAQLSADGMITCTNTKVILTAKPAGLEYDWGPGATPIPNTNQAEVMSGGTYRVTVTDPDNGCSNVAETNVQTNTTPPNATLRKSGDLTCSQTQVTITAEPPGLSYQWSVPNGASEPNSSTSSFNTSVPGTYQVTITGDNGCTNTATVTIKEIGKPEISASADPTCVGGTIQLGVSLSGGQEPFTYKWSGPLNYSSSEKNPTITNASLQNAGTYAVTVEDGNGCEVSTTVNVVVNEVNADAGQDVTICFGEATTLTASGGTTYKWNSGETTPSITVSPDADKTYTVTVTNGDCEGQASVDVKVTTTYTSAGSISGNESNCGAYDPSLITGDADFGNCENVTPQFRWQKKTTSQSWSTISNTNTQNYDPSTITETTGYRRQVRIAGSGTGWKTSNTVTKSVNQGPQIDLGNDQIVCKGQTTSITANVSGGTPQYQFKWSNNSTNPTISNVGPGTYTVTVTDANGCKGIESVKVIENPEINLSVSGNDSSCKDENDGSTNVMISGGTSPYNYKWSTDAITKNLTNLSPGTYMLTVTDANHCTATASVTINEPSKLTVSASATDVSCNGGSDGTASASGSGGTAPYTYKWSDGQTGSSATGLSAGTYKVTITDKNNCTAETSVQVDEPSKLSVSASAVDVSCNGGSDGTASASGSGGTAPYTYKWSDGQTGSSATGLSAGTYKVTVTDKNNCTGETTVQVNEPNKLTVSASATDVSCNDGSDGTTSASGSGGTAPYTYKWSDGQTGSSATGLSAGTYKVTITDKNNCTAETSVQVDEPSKLSVSASATDVSCNGGSDGTASASGSGGTAPYTYKWSDGQTGSSATGLSAGTYKVTITDKNNCTAETSVQVDEPSKLTVSASAVDVSCNGGSDGSTSASGSGGTSPYSYKWSDGQTGSSATGLSAGTYKVTITDKNNCTAVTSVRVDEPSKLTVSASAVDVSCNGGSDGSASASGSGGTAPYTYKWSDGQTGSSATGLSAGTYKVTITDKNNCTAETSVQVDEPNKLSVSASAVDVSCNGGSDGSASASGSGGTAPYTYKWSDGQTGSSATGLSAGTYKVTITDKNNCTAETSVQVDEPNKLSVSASAVDVSCNGGSDGSASASGSGGTAPYTYKWSDGQTGSSATGLSAGTYKVTITDKNNCTAETSVQVDEPSKLTVSANALDVSCNGFADGSATANAGGGTAPYNYEWSDGQTTKTATGLSAGSYSVTVTDKNNCTAETSVQVDEPSKLTVSANALDVSCNGFADGSATANAGGGTAPYNYEWSDGQTTKTATGLSAGSYSVTVTDKNNCTAETSVQVDEPSKLTVSANALDVSCNGFADGSATANAGGGTAPYNYEWSDGQTTKTATGLSAGSYSVTVTDKNNCTTQTNVQVNEPTLLLVTASKVDATCNEAKDGSATANVSGGTTPYNYEWSNGQTSKTISSLMAGTYSVTITDKNGCKTETSIAVGAPAKINFSIEGVDASCSDENNGSASVKNVTGGTAPYRYLWEDGQTTSSISGLSDGTYTVTVFDKNDCSFSQSVTISRPGTLVVTPTSSDVDCNGGNNGSASITVSGGVKPYQYLWSTGATSTSISNLTAGTYKVTVTDKNGCEKVEVIEIEEPDLISLTTQAIDATCKGFNDGSATVNVSGGTAPYQYAWSNGQSSKTATNLIAGTYKVTVTDKNNCIAETSVEVDEPTLLVVNATGVDASCNGFSDGSATANASGGTAPYIYAWSDGQTSKTATGLSAGTYQVTVTDKNDCKVQTSISINEPTLLVASASGTDVSCNGFDDGSAIANVSGGTTPYRYRWSDGQNTKTATGLEPGTYEVTITDNNNCEAQATVTITEPNLLSLSTRGSEVSCNGASDGTARVTASGGTRPYSYVWSNGQTNRTATNLSAGNYRVTVTDANGCIEVSQLIEVEEKPAIRIRADIQDETCFRAADGSIILEVTGGVPDYTFEWSIPTEATTELTGLLPGTYTVTVTDDDSCQEVKTFIVERSEGVTINQKIVNETCPGDADGSIELLFNGGEGPITVLWNTGSTNSKIENLEAGEYRATVTDGLGCDKIRIFPIRNVGEDCSTLYDLALDKRITSAGPYSQGSSVTYEINVTNEGALDASNVVVTDLPQTGLVYVGSDAADKANVSEGADLNFTIASLAKGETETIELSFTIADDFTGTSLVNQAEITEDDGDDVDSDPEDSFDEDDKEDGVEDDDEDEEEITIGQVYDLALAKSITSAGPYSQGSAVTYEVIVTNEGTLAASNVVVTDLPQTGLVYVGSNAGDNANVSEGADLNFTIASLAKGETETIELSFTIADDFTGTSLVNQAEITEDDGDDVDSDPEDSFDEDDKEDGEEDDDEDEEEITIGQVYDLALAKSITSAGPYSQGSAVTYEVTVTNEGTLAASNVVVTDLPQTGLVYVGSNAGDNANVNEGADLNFTIASLAKGETETIELSFTIADDFTGTSLVNQAEITEDDGEDVDSDPEDSFDEDDKEDGEEDDDEDEEEITIGQVYDLALAKSITSAGPYSQGSAVTYEVTVTNEGTLAASNVVVTDLPQTGLVYVGSDAADKANVSEGADLNFTIASLAKGETETIELSFTIADDFTGTSLVNQAEITEDDGEDVDSDPEDSFDEDDKEDGEEDDDEDEEEITIGQVYDLALAKSITSAGPYSQGSAVTYEVTVTNEGTLAASNVVVTDLPQTGLVYVGSNAGDNANVNEGADLNFTIASLAKGETETIELSFTIADDFTGTSLVNQAEITEDDGDDVDSDPEDSFDEDDKEDGVEDDDEDEKEITIGQVYDLALAKSITSAGPYSQGSAVTYEVTVTNEGTLAASNVVVTDLPQAGLVYVGSNAGDNANVNEGADLNFTIASLAKGETETIELSFTIADDFTGTSLVNQAEITEDDGDDVDSDPEDSFDEDDKEDGVEDDDEDEEEITIGQVYDLALAKSITSAGPYSQGSAVTYEVTVTNEGTLAASNVVVTDLPQTGLVYVGSNAGDNANVNEGADLNFTIASLAKGETETIELSFTIADDFTGTSLVNQAEITEDDGDDVDSDPEDSFDEDDKEDGEEDDDEDEEEITVGQVYDLALAKSITSAGPYSQGSAVTYEVTVTNEGTLAASNVVVTDLPQTGLVYVGSNAGDNANVNEGADLNFTIASLAKGETETIELSFTIADDFTGTSLVNQAEITEDDGDDVDSDPDDSFDDDDKEDGVEDDDEDEEEITIGQVYDLALAKSITSAGPYSQGSAVTYEVTVTNEGTLAASNVVVTDLPQTGLVYVGSNAGDNANVNEGADLNFTISSLAKGETETIELSFTIADDFTGTSLVNQAEITEDDGDDVDSDPEDSFDEDDKEDGEEDDDEDEEEITVEENNEFGNRVWEDLNENGRQDDGEPGIQGIGVKLYACSSKGMPNPEVLRSTVTNEIGEYLFTNLPAGSYYVSFELPTGYKFTSAFVGDELLDSNADPATGETNCVTLENNTSDLTYDVGVVRAGNCELLVQVDDIDCNDQETGDTGDDTFSFEIVVTGKETGTWTTTIAGTVFTGNYNEATEVGPFLIADGALSFSVTDAADVTCASILISVAPVEDCTGLCSLTAEFANITCDDNGTPFDPSDDVFFFDLTVTGKRTSETWIANDMRLSSGNYDVPVRMGPYAISDGDFELEIIDLADFNCATSLDIVAPAPCADVTCAILGVPSNIQCSDNGTPENPNDDVYTFDLLVSNGDNNGEWTASAPVDLSGEYGELVTVGPLPIDGEQISFVITDALDETCLTQVWVEVPNQCSISDCAITSVVENINIDDQGTPDDINDDTFTFSVLVSGLNTSAGWMADDANGTRGLYDSPVVFGPFARADGPVSIEIKDLLDATCSTIVEVKIPGDKEFVCVDDIVTTVTLDKAAQIIGGVLTNDLGTIDNVSELPWTTEDELPLGTRYYGTNTFTAEEAGTYTFLLYVQTSSLMVDGAVLPGLNDGNGALINGLGERLTWADSLVMTCENREAYTSAIFNYDLSSTTFDPEDWVVAMRFSAELEKDEVYTLVNSTFTAESTGAYAWVLVPEGETEMVAIDSEDTDGLAALLTKTLTTADFDAIFNNPASLGYLGMPTGEDISAVTFEDVYLPGETCTAPDVIVRTFTITFTDGTQDTTCEQRIILRKLLLSDVSAPVCNVYFDCENGPEGLDANGNPDPSISGFPYVVSGMGWVSIEEVFSNIRATYRDSLVVDTTCTGNFDIVRIWTITDECIVGSQVEYHQVLHFNDNTGPIVDCPVNNHYCPIIEEDIMLFSTDPFDCTATVTIPMPVVEDACSDATTVFTEIVQILEDGSLMVIDTIEVGADRTLEGLEQSDYFARYTVTDDCGNTTVKECRFRVADLEAPIAVCDTGIEVALGTSGAARVWITSLDNGSFDNCGVPDLAARRIVDTISVGSVDSLVYSSWADYVQFDCMDAGQEILAQVRTSDAAGNVSICHAQVTVVDRMAPWCGGLTDQTVDCSTLPSDFLTTNVRQLTELFGAATAYDNCTAYTQELLPELGTDVTGNCVITRRFTAVDASGNQAAQIFTQTIVISSNGEDCSACQVENSLTATCPTSNHYCPILEEDLMLYSTDSTTCVANFLAPLPIIENACSDEVNVVTEVFAIDYQFNLVQLPNGYRVDTTELLVAIQTIYTAEDRMVNNLSSGDYYFKYTFQDDCGARGEQWCKFRVADLVAPVVLTTDELRVALGGEGYAHLTTAHLDYGSYDNCGAITLQIRRAFTLDPLTGMPLSEPFFGDWSEHIDLDCMDINTSVLVEVQVTDDAGNHNYGTTQVVVVDELAPVCVHLADLTVNCVDLPADFNATDLATLQSQFGMPEVVDNCNAFVEELEPTIAKLDNGDCQITRSFIGIDESGNTSEISMQLITVATNESNCNVCEDGPLAAGITGQVRTSSGKAIENVEVILSGAENKIAGTNVEGYYDFGTVRSGYDYSLVAINDEDHMNGITTLDLLTIARHLAGQKLIDNPYDLIAADVNNSKSVSVGDLLELKRLIMGEVDELRYNTSWRFLDASKVLPDTLNPLLGPLPELISINNLVPGAQTFDFTGIKIGDINNSSIPNSKAGLTERSSTKDLIISVEDVDLIAGAEYTITFTAAELEAFLAYQFTLEVDPAYAQITKVIDGVAKEEDFGVRHLNQGMLSTSWHTLEGSTESSTALFELTIEAIAETKLSEILKLSSKVTKAEAYDTEQRVAPINLVFENAIASAAPFELLQNHPNPFLDNTVIGFNLPEAGEATLTIQDVRGRLVHRIEGQFAAGYNEVELSRIDIQAKGLYFYTLQAGHRVATKKMNILK